jgi:hypothetical protein
MVWYGMALSYHINDEKEIKMPNHAQQVDIMNIKQRFSFSPRQLEIFRSLLEPIVNNPPRRNDFKDIVKLDMYLEETLRKVYLGIKSPERIPVSDENRLRSKPFDKDGLGFSSTELETGKSEVVGFKNFEDALAASDFESEDHLMADILRMDIEEYRKTLPARNGGDDSSNNSAD